MNSRPPRTPPRPVTIGCDEYPHTSRDDGPRRHEFACGAIVEHGPGHLLADHATRFILDHLRVEPGSVVAEPGCGTALMSLFAARAGAALVHATDLDPAAVALARHNAAANGLPAVRPIVGDLLQPVPGPLDLVVALLPHKPAPRPFDPRYHGGPDGTQWLLPLIEQSAARLRRGGRLVLYAHSIANPRRVREAFDAAFDVRVLGEKQRFFTREEFDALTPGTMAHLEEMRRRGEAEFHGAPGRLWFFGRVFEGVRR